MPGFFYFTICVSPEQATVESQTSSMRPNRCPRAQPFTVSRPVGPNHQTNIQAEHGIQRPSPPCSTVQGSFWAPMAWRSTSQWLLFVLFWIHLSLEGIPIPHSPISQILPFMLCGTPLVNETGMTTRMMECVRLYLEKVLYAVSSMPPSHFAGRSQVQP